MDKIKSLNKEGKYSEAIKLIESNYQIASETDKIVLNEYSKALYKSANYEKSLKYSERLLEIDETHFGAITYYCWSFYKLYLSDIKKINENYYDKIKEKGFKALNAGSKKDDNRIFLNRTTLRMMKLAFESGNNDDVLKLAKYIVKDYDFYKRNKNSEYSEASRYYSMICKTYLRLGKFTEVLQYSEKALRLLDKKDVIWFEYYKIKALYNLGRIEEALNLLKIFKLRKSEPFVFEFLANIYSDKGDYKSAKENLLKAALLLKGNPKKHNFYMLYALLGENLIHNGLKEIGIKHIQLGVALCKEKGWKLKDDIVQLLDRFEVKLEEKIDTKEILKELSKFWEEEYYKTKTLYQGVIKKVFDKNGFITSSGKDYYFRKSRVKGNKDEIKEGSKVEFFIEESYDFSKDRISYSAIDVKII